VWRKFQCLAVIIRPPMIDCFALLNEPRRPQIDLEALKAKFRALSTESHPDRFHNGSDSEKLAANQRYLELNAAYNCLRHPQERLQHLLELERGTKPDDLQEIPNGAMNLFAEVGQLCRNVDAFLRERAEITSPLLKVQAFERAMEWMEKLKSLRQRINSQQEALMSDLDSLNAVWLAAPAVGASDRPDALPLAPLDQIYRVISYLSRWSEQIQERLVQLSF
jgi:molecular chaperone HscB